MTCYERAMERAIEAAEEFEGMTCPNPPVGAVALNSSGEIIGVAAHHVAGGPHAEVNLFKTCIQPIHTVVVTLEPCCHHGKTPPCVNLLIKSNVKCVVIGSIDPNPRVAGNGIQKLRDAGIEVIVGVKQKESDSLIAPFRQHILNRTPWVTIKRAFNQSGSMIPPKGQKTFTTANALREAHRLRKKCDAIITGSGTILSDNPLFTIRHVEDHPDKRRHLIVMDRRHRVSDKWIKSASQRGFPCRRGYDVEEVLADLGKVGVLRVLVEAGPLLSDYFLENDLYHEDIIFREGVDEPCVHINQQKEGLCLQASLSN